VVSGCSPTWTTHDNTNMPYGISSAADTVEDCRNECNFNATCIAVDWVGSAASGLRCWFHVYWPGGRSTSSSPGAQHHSITRKCGQLLFSIGRVQKCSALLSSNSTGTSFPVTSSRTCWRRRQLPRNKLATSYEEVGDVARPS